MSKNENENTTTSSAKLTDDDIDAVAGGAQFSKEDDLGYAHNCDEPDITDNQFEVFYNSVPNHCPLFQDKTVSLPGEPVGFSICALCTHYSGNVLQ